MHAISDWECISNERDWEGTINQEVTSNGIREEKDNGDIQYKIWKTNWTVNLSENLLLVSFDYQNTLSWF